MRGRIDNINERKKGSASQVEKNWKKIEKKRLTGRERFGNINRHSGKRGLDL